MFGLVQLDILFDNQFFNANTDYFILISFKAVKLINKRSIKLNVFKGFGLKNARSIIADLILVEE